jgi:perosamine synthetase
MSIPLSRLAGEPLLGGWYTEEEVAAAVDAIRRSMDPTVGFRAHMEVGQFERAFADFIGARHAIAVNGAGTALDMVLRVLNPAPDDEVISCAINFHGTHLAIIGAGGRLVLCEPNPSTLNLDADDLERRITSKTLAVVVTHMNGLSADMAAIERVVSQRHHHRRGPIRIVGDAARACGAMYCGTRVGCRGWVTAFSFQSKKLMTTLGEGGMLATDDGDLATRLQRMRSFGHGIEWGTNYKMTKPQAAVGLVQLKRLDQMNHRRRELGLARSRLLFGSGLQLPYDHPDQPNLYYLHTLVVPEGGPYKQRDELVAQLAARYGINSALASLPTYRVSSVIREHVRGQCFPISDSLGDRLFCPPLHPLMTDDDNERISLGVLNVVQASNNRPFACD